MIAVAFLAFIALIVAWLLAPGEETSETTSQPALPLALGETPATTA